MSRDNEVTIACRFFEESKGAMHIADADTGECYWIPHSQVIRTTRNPPDKRTGTITMTAWIAGQKGII